MKFAFRCIYWILYSEWNTLPVSGYISWKDTFGTCFLGMTSWVQVFQVAVQLSFCIRYIKDVKFLRKQMLPTHTVFITSCLSEVPPYKAHSENLLIVVSLEWSEHCSSHELERRISWLIFLGFKRKNLKPSFLYVPVTGNIFSTAKYTQTHQIFFNNKKKMGDQPWTFSWQHFINNTICIWTIYFNSNVM